MSSIVASPMTPLSPNPFSIDLSPVTQASWELATTAEMTPNSPASQYTIRSRETIDMLGQTRRVLIFSPVRKTFDRDLEMIDYFSERGVTINPMPTPELDSAQKRLLRDLDASLWDTISVPSDTPVKRRIDFSNRFTRVSSPVDAVIRSRSDK